jgi:hypothetical protein
LALPKNIAPINTEAWPETEGWNLIRYMIDACHDLERPELIDQIKIEFRSGMSRTVGRAFSRTKTIALSRFYWAYLPEYEKRDTMIHEVCHIATPGNGHGRKWKDAMIKCGLEPNRFLKPATGNLVKRMHEARHGDVMEMWEYDLIAKKKFDAGKCPECKHPMWWKACIDGVPIRGLEGYYRKHHVLVGECSYGTSFWGTTNMERDKTSEYYHYGRPEARIYVRANGVLSGWKIEGT